MSVSATPRSITTTTRASEMTSQEAADLIRQYDDARDNFDLEDRESQIHYSQVYLALYKALTQGA